MRIRAWDLGTGRPGDRLRSLRAGTVLGRTTRRMRAARLPSLTARRHGAGAAGGKSGEAGRDSGDGAPGRAAALTQPAIDLVRAFETLDLRVGRFPRAEPNERARKPSYKLWIDFG